MKHGIGEPDTSDHHVLRLGCMSCLNVKDDVVNDSVDTSPWRYAVISVQSEPDRELVVIAYTDEETLRDLIAAPSIVALVSSSPADALKNIDRYVSYRPFVEAIEDGETRCKHDLFDSIAATRRRLWALGGF